MAWGCSLPHPGAGKQPVILGAQELCFSFSVEFVPSYHFCEGYKNMAQSPEIAHEFSRTLTTTRGAADGDN